MNRSFPAQRSNAIYGDSNAQTATVVPDLAAAADGTNFAVSADSSVLNFNQRLDLQDLIYETSTEEVYVSTISDGNLVIQGNTMGWTDVSKMVLEFDVEFSRDVNDLQPTLDNDQRQGTEHWGEFQRDFYRFPVQDSSKFAMANFNLLQPLDQLVIQMGENNQVIGRSQMNYLPGIKMCAQDNKVPVEDYREVVQMGSPFTQSWCGVDQDPLMNNMSAGYVNSAEFTKWQTDLYKQIHQYMCARYVDAEGTGTPVPWLNDSIQFKVGIPLKYLNSFFREKAYLPPGLKYRFEIKYNAATHFFYDYVFYTSPLGGNDAFWQYDRVNLKYNKNFRLTYRRSNLRQPQAAAIMNQWITKPFLYLYNTYEYVEIPTDGATTTFTKDIAISQQRPSSIFIKVLPNYSGTEWTRRRLGQYRPRNTKNPEIRDFKASDCACISFTNIKIDIAGRQQYYLRNIVPNATKLIPSLFDGTVMVNQLANKNINQDYDRQMLVNVSHFCNDQAGGPLEISINPGDMQKNGYMSSDVGATVIRVTVDVEQTTLVNEYKPVPTGYKVVIYKRLQEELEINGKKEITTIHWPAVKSNSNYIIQNTYNLN